MTGNSQRQRASRRKKARADMICSKESAQIRLVVRGRRGDHSRVDFGWALP